MNALEVRARSRRLARQYGGKLGAIVVDYLQLMQAVGDGENRATEISEISRSMKALAKELKVPVLALSQLNRSLEQRPNKRPVMSDLRESGAIEQDADVILFIYREEVYNPDTQEKGVAEIIIGKQRNGPIGMVRLAFLGENTRNLSAQRIGAAEIRSVEVAAVVDLAGHKFGAVTIERCRKALLEDLRLRHAIVGVAIAFDDNAIDPEPPFFFDTFGGGLVGRNRRHRRAAVLSFYLGWRDRHRRLGRGDSTRQKEEGSERVDHDTPNGGRVGATRKILVRRVSHSGTDHGAGALISHGKLRVSNTLSRLSWKLMLPVIGRGVRKEKPSNR